MCVASVRRGVSSVESSWDQIVWTLDHDQWRWWWCWTRSLCYNCFHTTMIIWNVYLFTQLYNLSTNSDNNILNRKTALQATFDCTFQLWTEVISITILLLTILYLMNMLGYIWSINQQVCAANYLLSGLYSLVCLPIWSELENICECLLKYF